MDMKTSDTLEGRRILVTGASSGIGRACAVRLAQQGATLVLTGRNPEALAQTRQQLENPEVHQLYSCDLGNLETIEGLVKFAAGSGKLNGIVHAAGVCPALPVGVFNAAAAEQVMRVNCWAFLELMKFCAKKKFGADGFAAVAISSVSAAAGWAGGSVYSATKGALSAAVRSLAIELAPRRYRINAISPSNIKTPMFDALAVAMNDERALTALQARQPLGFGEPSEVAAAVAFLLSDASSFVTGVDLPVDGGYLAQ